MVLYSIAHCTVSRMLAATPDTIMHLITHIMQSKWKLQVLGAKEILSIGLARKKEPRL